MYLAHYDNNKPGTVTLRMDLINKSPLIDYPFILITGITFKSNREDGFPEKKSMNDIYKISDELVKLINEQSSNIHVGTFMYNYERLEYFYLHSIGEIKTVLQTFYKSKYPNYKTYINIKNDADWDAYRTFLYPNEMTLNAMGDERVIRNLMKHKDQLHKIRPVEHWFYSKSKSKLELFKAETIDLGFEIISLKKTENDNYCLIISKNSAATFEVINKVTTQLKVLAQKNGCDYDGWETIVVK